MLTPNVNLENKTVLVTGAAGFIGSNLVTELFNTTENIIIVGLDSVNDYYDVSIKEYRLREIEKVVSKKSESKWIFVKGNLADKELIKNQAPVELISYTPDASKAIARAALIEACNLPTKQIEDIISNDDERSKIIEMYRKIEPIVQIEIYCVPYSIIRVLSV